MRKILVLIGLVLLLGACGSKEVGVATTSAKEDTKQAEDVKEKDNELIVEVDGKEEVIPAKIEKDVSFIKEIKVPEGSKSFVNPEDGAYVTEYAGTRFSIEEKGTEISIDNLMTEFTWFHEASEPGKIIEITELDLNDYPEIKGYDKMAFSEGTKIKTYYLLKNNEDSIEEVLIEIPSTEKNTEKRLRTMLKVLSTVKS